MPTKEDSHFLVFCRVYSELVCLEVISKGLFEGNNLSYNRIVSQLKSAAVLFSKIYKDEEEAAAQKEEETGKKKKKMSNCLFFYRILKCFLGNH